MPLIRFKYAHPDGTPMSGTVHATPTRRHHRDDRVILPAPLTIEVDSTGEATADLAPTGDTWVWEFREHMNLPHPAVVYKMVPDQTGGLDFTDLVEVDPRSLQETATPEARWWIEIRANNATAAEVRDIRDLVLPARDQTLAARDETLAHGITVDTSVGTRVFVGDTMIHGDTGVRDVQNYLLNGWKRRSSGRALVSRVGDIVYVQLEYLDGSNATSDNLLQLPVGFRPDSAGSFLPLSGYDFNGTPIKANVSWDGIIIGAISDAPSFVGSFRTRQAWPTTLPWEPR